MQSVPSRRHLGWLPPLLEMRTFGSRVRETVSWSNGRWTTRIALHGFRHHADPKGITFSQAFIELVSGKGKNIGRIIPTVFQKLGNPFASGQSRGFQNDQQIHIAAGAEIASRKRAE
jgi:hypothetical protein